MGKYPAYSVHWKSGEGELRADFAYHTTILDHFAMTEFIRLDKDGWLYLSTGYVWDFGSGPAINTPDMVYASLVHDALYELMVLGKLPWALRKRADKLFKAMLKEARMPWMRRQWVYLGVRWGYPMAKALGRMGKSTSS